MKRKTALLATAVMLMSRNDGID